MSRRRFLGTAAATVGAATLALRALAREGTARAEAPGSPSGDVSQWAMVIDLARCDGCGECTEACRETHFTEDREWIPVFEMRDEAGGRYFLPRPCMQCENAPCLNVCPVGATYRDEHGNILVDHNRCIGCRICMAACPYGARTFVWGEPTNPPAATLATYTPEYPVPHRKGTVEKCVFCAHNTEMGKLPACVSACPMNALWFGDLTRDVATNGVETAKLSWLLRERDAFRLKEELGTRPRVWYLPGHGQNARNVQPI